MGGQFPEASRLPWPLKANQPFAATEDPLPDTCMRAHTHTHTLHCRECRGSSPTAMPVTPARGSGSTKLPLPAGICPSVCGISAGTWCWPGSVPLQSPLRLPPVSLSVSGSQELCLPGTHCLCPLYWGDAKIGRTPPCRPLGSVQSEARLALTAHCSPSSLPRPTLEP